MNTHTLNVFGIVLVLACIMPALAWATPPGPAISIGANPIRSSAGVIDLGVTDTATGVIAAPADQDLILTDVVMGVSPDDNSCYCTGQVRFNGSDGELYGSYLMGVSPISSQPSVSRQFTGASGIRIPAGVTIDVVMELKYNYCGSDHFDLLYTLSGYLAQP